MCIDYSFPCVKLLRRSVSATFEHVRDRIFIVEHKRALVFPNTIPICFAFGSHWPRNHHWPAKFCIYMVSCGGLKNQPKDIVKLTSESSHLKSPRYDQSFFFFVYQIASAAFLPGQKWGWDMRRRCLLLFPSVRDKHCLNQSLFSKDLDLYTIL